VESNGSVEKTFVPSAGWFPLVLVLVLAGVIVTPLLFVMVNTAEALFEVDDYEDYVGVQSEAALKNLATRHPYDSHDHEPSLRSNTQEISDQLRTDIQDRLNKAGVEVIEARISHLAYAPEVAAAMLQRQQASAVVAARTKIVEGAVGMVQLALDHLNRDKDCRVG
jgi:regulator of protease activity HflC (stomatin/prohibitin superfamily)